MITGRSIEFIMPVVHLMPLAATMAWVEIYLNFTNAYYKVTSSESDHFDYLVPFPPGYTSTMKAYWTTDVIVLDPVCSWQSATTTEPFNSTWDVTLAESNLITIVRNDDFCMFLLSSNVFMCLLDFSIKPFLQYDEGFGFPVLQQWFGIHSSSSRRWFRTFCYI